MPLSSATKYQKTNPRSLQGGSFGKTIIGISYKDSITVIVIMNGAGIPGRLVPGFLADRWFGCLNVEIAFCCLTGVTMFCWIPVSSYTSLLIFSAVYGFFGAGVQSLFAATLASLSPDASKTGVRLGMVFSFISIACLTGEPVAGAIIQASNGNYVRAQIYAGCLKLAGTLILVGSQIAHTGWKIRFRI
jgi:MFS family permease